MVNEEGSLHGGHAALHAYHPRALQCDDAMHAPTWVAVQDSGPTMHAATWHPMHNIPCMPTCYSPIFGIHPSMHACMTPVTMPTTCLPMTPVLPRMVLFDEVDANGSTTPAWVGARGRRAWGNGVWGGGSCKALSCHYCVTLCYHQTGLACPFFRFIYQA